MLNIDLDSHIHLFQRNVRRSKSKSKPPVLEVIAMRGVVENSGIFISRETGES